MMKFLEDPLMEDKFSPMKGLVYKYPGRVLLEMNNICANYCFFCTRKRKTFIEKKWELTKNEIKNIIGFINKNKEINEIIISGGDPLMSPGLLIYFLKKIESINKLKVIRIHTRMPVAKPLDIDKNIFSFLSKYRKIIYLSIHCNLVEELNTNTIKILDDFKKIGIILYSQSVFLKGINDSAEKLEILFSRLLELGVRPYCIYRCDAVIGLKDFVVPLKKEKKIMMTLRKKISGLACPIYVIDGLTKKKFVDFQ